MLNAKLRYALLSAAVFVILSLSALNIFIFYKNQNPEVKEEPELALTFWKKISQEYPTYKDAYIEIAHEEKQIGNTIRAQEALSKARGLDPNFSKF
jgi:hypothetical protein